MNGIPRTIKLISSIAVLAVLIIGAMVWSLQERGATPVDNDAVEIGATIPEVTAGDILYIEQGEQHNLALIGRSLTNEEVFRIPVPNATASTTITGMDWIPDGSGLVWMEQDAPDSGITIIEYLFGQEATTRSVGFSSGSELEQLAVSPNTFFVSYIENESLFVIHREDGGVHRIVEGVKEYIWSPYRNALLYRTATETSYIELDSNGSPGQITRLVENPPLQALSFIDEQTVFGLRKQEGESEEAGEQHAVVTIDLRTGDENQLFTIDAREGARIESFVSPNKRDVILNEYQEGSERNAIANEVRLLSLAALTEKQLGIAQTALAWQDTSSAIMIANANGGYELRQLRITSASSTPLLNIPRILLPTIAP